METGIGRRTNHRDAAAMDAVITNMWVIGLNCVG